MINIDKENEATVDIVLWLKALAEDPCSISNTHVR